VNRFEWRGVLYAVIYGAATVTIAYFVAHGSLIVFILVMIGIGILIRAWAIWYRLRHDLPIRRPPRRPGRHRDL
jgi:hypothetical protein